MVSLHGYVAAVPPLGAADTGGQVVYVLELSRKLAQLGYDVDIWTRRFDDQSAAEEVAPRVRILRAPCGGPGFLPKERLVDAVPEWCENALRLIREEGIGYTFVNSHYWDAGLAGRHLADVLGVPHVHTPHSLGLWKQRQMEQDFPGDLARLEERYNFAQRIREERELYHQAAVVLATTPVQLDLLRTGYEVPQGQMHMIPPGYDDNRYYPVGDAARALVRRRLGYEGPVVAAVQRRVPEATLHLAVGGEEMGENERKQLAELQAVVAELGLGGRVRFSGFVPEEQLADFYRAADVFVLSSRYEPFGMTAIEAMACGTPTVVTVHGGLYRALTFGRHALFADPFDAEDLGITICKILRHPRLRARLTRMGAHKARSLFTWTGVAQQLVALVEERASPAFAFQDSEWDEPWNDGD
jgi:mannosylfructose-phosphate synthase